MIVHPQVRFAHLAGCAASMQGKFVEFKDAWWEKAFQTHQITPEKAEEIAKDLGLDMAKFNKDKDSKDCAERVDGDMAELAKWHTNATPSFYINGKFFSWRGDPGEFKSEIDADLKQVESSGVPAADYYQKEVMEKGEKTFRAKKDPKPPGH